SHDVVEYLENENLLKVKHAGFANQITGNVSADKKHFVFHN
ncbi:uncharacterized protein METZ01_LOCUS481235, partial [marine metagenome]